MSENTSVKEVKSNVEFAVGSPLTNRTYEEYVKYLGVNEADLGKTVLDLGSGRTERFARTAHEKGIQVFSVSPNLADSNDLNSLDIQKVKSRHDDMNNPNYDRIKTKDVGRTVAAVAQKLPFKSESFDSVISLWAVPYYVPDMDLKKTLEEIMRVLKPRGRGFFGPVSTQRMELEEILNDLQIKHEFTSYNEEVDDGVQRDFFTLKIEK